VRKIEHTESIGTATWDQISRWGQYVESGIYIYHITSHSGKSSGATTVGKFSIVR